MTLALTIAQVKKHKPCDAAMERLGTILPARKRMNAADARAYGATYEDIIWIAAAVAMDDDTIARRLTEFVNDCAKRVLHLWEQQVPDDDRPRRSIQAADDWLDGIVSEPAWKDAAGAAWAAWDVARDAWAVGAAGAAGAAWDVARAARDARDARAARDAWAARSARAAQDAWVAWVAWAAFKKWQFDRLVYWLTEAEPVRLSMPEFQKDVEGE